MNYIWPPLTPRTVSKNHKEVIKMLEVEELAKLKLLKNFEYPEFNVGDVVSFHYLHSLSEGRGNKFTGLVVARWAHQEKAALGARELQHHFQVLRRARLHERQAVLALRRRVRRRAKGLSQAEVQALGHLGEPQVLRGNHHCAAQQETQNQEGLVQSVRLHRLRQVGARKLELS